MKQETKGMLYTIFVLAWPTMLEQLMQTAVQYIDTAMVGTLGTQATAAVGATSTVNWLVSSMIASLGVGFLAYISQSMGAGEEERARQASAQAVTVVLIAGIAMTAITTLLSSKIPVWMRAEPVIRDMAARYFLILYMPMLFRSASIVFGTVLRSAGDTETPMRVGLAMNIVNVILNFLLIYPTRAVHIFSCTFTMPGMGWGIEGAAWASAAAFVLGGSIMTLRLFRHPRISPVGNRFLPDWSVLKPCLRVAMPNMLQRFGTCLGYVVFASMINALGDISTAAHTIANTVESLFYIPGYGMQTAAATLAGNALGARDGKRLRMLGKNMIGIEVALMVFSGSMLFLFAPNLMRIFSGDPQVIRMGTAVLRMVAVSEPFYGVPIVLEGIMQGVGKTVAPFVYNISGMWLIRIAGTFICTRLLGMGLVSAWGCMIGHNMLLFCLFSFHYASGRIFPKELVSDGGKK